MLQLTEILCLKLQIICVGPSCRPWSLGKQCDKIVLPTNFMNSRTVYRTCTYRMGPTHSAFSINDNKFHPFSSKLQLGTKFSDYQFVLISFFLNRVRSKKHCFRVAEKENGRNHRIVQKSQETQNQSQRSQEAMLDERLSLRRHFRGKKRNENT